ncbi:ALF repeat-containing protein [Streptomyces hydrogenans]
MAEARLLAEIEAQEQAELARKRTQSEQTEQALQTLITQAEQALADGDLTLAVTLGRKAAVGLLGARGAWTREAAQFALCGTEADVRAWIDTDRVLAQGQDDRETALYVAQISSPAIGTAAHQALASADTQATRAFLTSGMVEAAAPDNRVQIFRILGSNPGQAVRAAAEAAVDAETATALQAFFETGYAAAVREDDAVVAATLLSAGGQYTKAYAEVALEGPTWMRRNFVDLQRHKAAQLDQDSVTHISAIRGAIAAAAKIAAHAQRNAALASKVAAEARNAAQEASDWADKAQIAADTAAAHAAKAQQFADAADKSAADAKASAATASAAAQTARGAARSANYSANRAVDAARRALDSSYSAQASAASARQSALAAGQSAQAAASAATDARRIATQKRQAEIAEAARVAAVQAQRDRDSATDPADSSTHDQVNPNGSNAGGEKWYEDAKWWADTANYVSIGTGFLAAGLGIASLAFPPLAVGAVVLGYVSLGAGALSAVFTGMEYGFTSSEFAASAGSALLGLVTFGQSKWIGALGGTKAATKVTQFAHDLVSPIVGTLSTWF